MCGWRVSRIHPLIHLHLDCIYVLGGVVDDWPVDNADCYDIAQGRLIRLPSMIDRRQSPGACLNGDRIVVCGGHDGTEYLRACEEFNTTTQRSVFSSSFRELSFGWPTYSEKIMHECKNIRDMRCF